MTNPGEILRHARLTRGIAQLELALRIGVSQRHVSFVEGGRASPSRDLILSWMREVGAPLSLRNAALARAGYAPAFPKTKLSDASMAPAMAALSSMLQGHEPFPGIVFDADWMMLELNEGGQWLCAILLPEFLATVADPRGGMDMIAALEHPGGLFSRMRDPQLAGSALLSQLRAEQWARPALKPRIERFETSLIERFGGCETSEARQPGEPYLNLVFDTELGVLSFFTIQSVFGLPQDVTLASLRTELWFPSDEATREVMRARAGCISREA